MIEDLSAEELARRLDFAANVLCQAASNFRNESMRTNDRNMISVGFQRHIGSFIEAVNHANNRAAGGPAATPTA